MENTSGNDNATSCNVEVEAPLMVHDAPAEQSQTYQTQSEQPQPIAAKKKRRLNG